MNQTAKWRHIAPYCPVNTRWHRPPPTHTHWGVCFKCSILLYIIKVSWKATIILLHIKCSVHLVEVRQKSCLYSSSCQSTITVKCTNLTKKLSFPLYMPVTIKKRQWQPSSSIVIPRCSPNSSVKRCSQNGMDNSALHSSLPKSSPATGDRRRRNTNANAVAYIIKNRQRSSPSEFMTAKTINPGRARLGVAGPGLKRSANSSPSIPHLCTSQVIRSEFIWTETRRKTRRDKKITGPWREERKLWRNHSS